MGATVDYTGHTLDGRYSVIRLLGQGGMGTVYLGKHTVIGRKLAIKFLHSDFASSEEVLKRFYREAQAAAAIGHKNIIEVIDVGASPSGDPFLVMEYLEGEDVETMIERVGVLDLPAACGVLEPVLRALAAAHEKGIVHRDLKPANIFITQPEGEEPAVKLIDFGISKFTGVDDQTKLTQTGSLLGTPAYMSPEQARGTGEADHRTDLYAVGVILYQLLTGELPFKGESYNDLLIKVLTEPYQPPSQLRADFPIEAEPVIARALAKVPDDRFQTAMEMLSAFEELAAYAKRRDSFDMLVSGIKTSTAASGDLGSKIAVGREVASATDVLAKIAARGTPTDWASTSTPQPGKSKLFLAIGGAIAAVVAIVTIVVVFAKGSDDPAPVVAPLPQSRPSPERVPAPDRGVQITIEGAPMGAKVYYDNAPVPINPFRVDKAETLKSIKVEAKGFNPFITSIVPSSNQIVHVSLDPLVEVAEPVVAGRSGTSTRGSKSKSGKKPTSKGIGATDAAKQPSTTKSTPPKPTSGTGSKKKIVKGGKGTLYAEDFD